MTWLICHAHYYILDDNWEYVTKLLYLDSACEIVVSSYLGPGFHKSNNLAPTILITGETDETTLSTTKIDDPSAHTPVCCAQLADGQLICLCHLCICNTIIIYGLMVC